MVFPNKLKLLICTFSKGPCNLVIIKRKCENFLGYTKSNCCLVPLNSEGIVFVCNASQLSPSFEPATMNSFGNPFEREEDGTSIL